MLVPHVRSAHRYRWLQSKTIQYTLKYILQYNYYYFFFASYHKHAIADLGSFVSSHKKDVEDSFADIKKSLSQSEDDQFPHLPSEQKTKYIARYLQYFRFSNTCIFFITTLCNENILALLFMGWFLRKYFSAELCALIDKLLRKI